MYVKVCLCLYVLYFWFLSWSLFFCLRISIDIFFVFGFCLLFLCTKSKIQCSELSQTLKNLFCCRKMKTYNSPKEKKILVLMPFSILRLRCLLKKQLFKKRYSLNNYVYIFDFIREE